MVDLDRYYLAVMVEAGFIYMGMQRLTEAREVFEGVRSLAPHMDIPAVALGNVAFCEGNIAKALKHYNDALKIDASSLYARVYMGEALLFDGKHEEGLALLEQVHREDPRGAAGGFAIALIDAVKQGFNPTMSKQHMTKKVSDATHRKTKNRR